MFRCPLYIHNTKKACFARLGGCPYALIHLAAPICLNASLYVGISPCMFGCSPYVSLYVWTPPYVWMPLYVRVPPVWMPPVCLDTPYVWMIFGCPLYIHNTKKGCFVRLRGCPYAPIHLDAPCTYTTQRKYALSD